MNIKTDFDMFAKPLNEEIALEKGIEFAYEIIFYGLVIVICSYEIAVGYFKGIEKKENDKIALDRLGELLAMKEA